MSKATIATDVELVEISTRAVGSSLGPASVDGKFTDGVDLTTPQDGETQDNSDTEDTPDLHFEKFDDMSKARIALVLFR